MRQVENPFHDPVPADMEQPKSKTRRKKEMIELQKLGEQLLALPGSYLKKSGIPHELLDAVLSMKNMRTHEARRRHMQHIGVIMRDVDEAHIRKVLGEFGQSKQTPAAVNTDLDEPSQTLINGTAEHIEDIIKRYPGSDRSRLRQLVRNAKAEASQGNSKKSCAALKSYLEELMK